MSVTEQALAVAEELAKPFEGLFLKPYLCPAGVPTIGYGSTMYEDGTRVTLQDATITRERALSLLRLTLRRDYMVGIIKASPGLLRWAARLGAMTDFGYNLGVPRYRASTLKRRIDAEDWAGAREEVMKWNRGGGRVLAGLTKRCKARAALL